MKRVLFSPISKSMASSVVTSATTSMSAEGTALFLAVGSLYLFGIRRLSSSMDATEAAAGSSTPPRGTGNARGIALFPECNIIEIHFRLHSYQISHLPGRSLDCTRELVTKALPA
jgi:hypothetical protein